MRAMTYRTDLCTHLERKLSVFRRYLSITEKMKRAVGNPEGKALRNLLAERRSCIKRIENIDGTMGKIPGSDEIGMPFTSAKSKARVHQVLNHIAELMETIAPLDREVMHLVKSESDALRSGLLKIRHTRKAAAGYGHRAAGPSRFLDTRN